MSNFSKIASHASAAVVTHGVSNLVMACVSRSRTAKAIALPLVTIGVGSVVYTPVREHSEPYYALYESIVKGSLVEVRCSA